jgi:hypothetical protein
MTSWRSGTDPQAQSDLDELTVMALGVAEQLLERNGGFLPFGAAIERTGDTRLLQADHGDGEPPETDAAIANLLDGIRSASHTMRCVALVMDVLMDGSDAVRVELEHRRGVVLRVLMPYRLRRVSGGVERGDLIVEPGQPMVWLGQPDDEVEGSSG